MRGRVDWSRRFQHCRTLMGRLAPAGFIWILASLFTCWCIHAGGSLWQVALAMIGLGLYIVAMPTLIMSFVSLLPQPRWRLSGVLLQPRVQIGIGLLALSSILVLVWQMCR